MNCREAAVSKLPTLKIPVKGLQAKLQSLVLAAGFSCLPAKLLQYKGKGLGPELHFHCRKEFAGLENIQVLHCHHLQQEMTNQSISVTVVEVDQ